MERFSGRDDWSGGARFESLANLAHELRTPVQVLLGYLDILGEARDDAGEADSSKSRHGTIIERMNANALELAQTVENLIEFALASAGAESVVEEEIDLRKLFGELEEVLAAAKANRNVAVRINLDEAPRAIISQRRPLRSIVLNLAINAIKFTEDGAVTIGVTGAAGDPENIEIEIRDTGAGISSDHVSSVFEPLVQLSHSSRRRYRGLGLGLAIVQRNVDTLKGRLVVESVPGFGSRFKIVIPRGRTVPCAFTLGHPGDNLAC